MVYMCVYYVRALSWTQRVTMRNFALVGKRPTALITMTLAAAAAVTTNAAKRDAGSVNDNTGGQT